jgi:predicted RNA-binding Zn ribbon-like protein
VKQHRNDSPYREDSHKQSTPRDEKTSHLWGIPIARQLLQLKDSLAESPKEPLPPQLDVNHKLAEAADAICRIADHIAPQTRKSVNTKYVATKLGTTTKWVGDLIRRGDIPNHCICPKSGKGCRWLFWKDKIDKWIEER